jgi:hypothetical protein
MKKTLSFVMMVVVLLMAGAEIVSGQGTVPAGINYQAVARDNNGKEIVNTDIEVRFTIRSGSPTGTPVYQEVFTDVTTTKYGVFSLVIGKGDPVSGSFSAIDWSAFNHYLQVEVKFENIFMDMGTMQFMAVPYALYAARSLEPGPQGPPGPQGIPGPEASDDQTLAYDKSTRELSISGGNKVTLGTEIAFRARNLISDPAAQLSNVIMTYDAPDLSVGGGFDPATGVFTVPADGIYTFNVSYYADGDEGEDARRVSIYVNSALYETIASGISAKTTIPVRSVTARLSAGNTVSVVIYTGTAFQTGTGSFAGYKVD